ncbi:MAG TPA: PHP domain-containing protein [Tissierellia bacterium]|nr:PHP domain-containing protein [Tissierellia bacterium]
MLIDTHMHETIYSSDSFLEFREAITMAKARGLDGICITNHDNNHFRHLIGDSALIDGILVLVGSEVYTREGDILTFGLPDIPELTEPRIPAGELLDQVKQAGGVAIAAHPYRHNMRGLGDHILRFKELLHGVESFNGSTFEADNRRALHTANQAGLPSSGAGDAHVAKQVGVFATRFEHRIRDLSDFIEAIKSGHFSPVRYQAGGYQSLTELPTDQTIAGRLQETTGSR